MRPPTSNIADNSHPVIRYPEGSINRLLGDIVLRFLGVNCAFCILLCGEDTCLKIKAAVCNAKRAPSPRSMKGKIA